jgi:hypothetical protein
LRLQARLEELRKRKEEEERRQLEALAREEEERQRALEGTLFAFCLCVCTTRSAPIFGLEALHISNALQRRGRRKRRAAPR